MGLFPCGWRMAAGALLSATLWLDTDGALRAAPAIPTDAYRNIVRLDLGACVAAIDRLTERLEAGDIVGAKQAWIDAKRGWTRSEAVTEVFFSYQDEVLDGWPEPPFGLHVLEAQLFGAGDTAAALAEARYLTGAAGQLAGMLKGVTFDPQGLLDGAVDLLGEIGAGNDGGAEARISGTAIYDLQHNVDGIRTLYGAVFKRPLGEVDPQLAAAIAAQIVTLGRVLRHDNFAAVDRAALAAESGRLARLFVEAAGPLGLVPPRLAN